MKILKKVLVLTVMLVMTVSVGMMSNESMAKSKKSKTVKTGATASKVKSTVANTKKNNAKTTPAKASQQQVAATKAAQEKADAEKKAAAKKKKLNSSITNAVNYVNKSSLSKKDKNTYITKLKKCTSVEKVNKICAEIDKKIVNKNTGKNTGKSTGKNTTAQTKKTNIAEVGNKKYTTLKSAINAVKKDNKQQTIKLLKNISQSDAVTIAKGQNIVLDTGKYTLKVSKAITNNGKLKVKGSGGFISTKDDKGIENNGTLIISGSVNTSTIYNLHSGTLKVTGGNIKGGIANSGTTSISGKDAIIDNKEEYKGKEIYSGSTITNSKTLKVSGGTIKTSDKGTAISNGKDAKLTLTGGKIISKNGYAIDNLGKVTNSGGIITGKTKGIAKNVQNTKSVINEKKEKNKTLKSNEGLTGLNKAPRIYIDSKWSPTGKNPEDYIAIKIVDGVKIDSVTNDMKAKVKAGAYQNLELSKKEIDEKTQYRYIKKSELKQFKSATISITVKDTPQGLESKRIFKITNKGNNKISVNESMRVNYSFSNNKLNLILTNYDGIANGNAKVVIKDKNSNKTIKTLTAKKLEKQLKSTTKYKGNIVHGMLSLDIGKLQAKDGKYRIKVETIDASGVKGYDMMQFTNGIKENPANSYAEPNNDEPDNVPNEGDENNDIGNGDDETGDGDDGTGDGDDGTGED